MLLSNSDPIFVVGCPRSGTHLLRYCLSKHPNIYIGPETGFFIKVYGNRRLLRESKIKKNAELIVTRMFDRSGDPSIKDCSVYSDDIAERIKQHGNTYRDFAEIIFHTCASRHGKNRWGEKTPLHVLYLKQIFELFPDAKIINVTREAKNIVSSFIRSSLLPANFYRAVAYYILCSRSANQYAEKIYTVSYEDLTSKSEEVLKGVCDFIGEQYYPEMLQPGMKDSSDGENIMEFSSSIGIEKNDEFKWRNHLSPRQSDFIDSVIYGKTHTVDWGYLIDLIRLKLHILRLEFNKLKNSYGYEDMKRYVFRGFRFF